MRSICCTRGLVRWHVGRAVLGLLLVASATAQAVDIAPVVAEIAPSRRVAAIVVSNADAHPVSLQTQALSWRQVDGVDNYQVSTHLIVEPSMAEIAAGGSQVFRVTTRLPADAREAAFRLIFETVAGRAARGEGADAIQVLARADHNLPIFFAPGGMPSAQLRVAPCVAAPPAGRSCVRIENSGNRHTVVKSLAISSGDWHEELPVSTRVLAGAWRQWEFEVPGAAIGSVQVTARTSAGLITGALSID